MTAPLNTARLLPHEIERRRAAYARVFGNPPSWAGNSGMAGVNSTPVPAKAFPPGLDLPAAETLPAFSSGVVCVVSYDEARRWAAAQGLAKFRKALDLVAVNAARREMRLPPFALKGDD